MLSFKEFEEKASAIDFWLSKADNRNQYYEFADDSGENKLTFKQLPAPIDVTVIQWEVRLNDEEVDLDDPTAMNSICFILSQLFSKSVIFMTKMLKNLKSN